MEEGVFLYPCLVHLVIGVHVSVRVMMVCWVESGVEVTCNNDLSFGGNGFF